MNPSDYAVKKLVEEIELEKVVEIESEEGESKIVRCDLPMRKHKIMSPINLVAPCGELFKLGDVPECFEKQYQKCNWKEAKKYFDRMLS